MTRYPVTSGDGVGNVTDGRPSSLTPAQERVMRLLHQGLTVMQAAMELDVSYHTAHTLSQQAHERLDVQTKREVFIALGWEDADKP